MMFRASRRAFSLVIIMFLSLLLAATGIVAGLGASPAHATWNPQPPLSEDYGCIKWDRIWIPQDDYASYQVEGQSGSLPQNGWWYVKTGYLNGASEVTVVAKNYYDPDKKFTFSFSTEPDSSCAQAQNAISVTKGTCNSGDSLWNVNVSLANTADATGWPLPPGNLVDFDPQFPAYGAQFRYGGEIADGQSAATTLGLPPGTYKVYEVLPSGQRIYRLTRFIDGKCGTAVVSSYDPNYSGGSTTTVIRPRLAARKITSIRGGVVTVNNRYGKTTLPVKVKFDPRRGKTIIRSRTLKRGEVWRVVNRKVRLTAVVTVTYRLNGRTYLWKKTLRRSSR